MNAMKKLICLLLMLCAGTAAFAWGGREHRLIAYIAEAHLTPRTRQVLDRYLDQSIVEYSTWMDRYRTAPGYEITTYWHMVTIDKDGSVPPEPLRPNGDGDAVRQLTRAIERLRTVNSPIRRSTSISSTSSTSWARCTARGTSISPICRAAWTPRGTTTSFS